MAFFFLWDPVVHHFEFWSTPGDIWATFQVSGRVAHGHVGTIYVQYPDDIFTFPGLIFILTPLAALTSGLHLSADTKGPLHLVAQPGAWLLLAPVMLVLSTVPLLACDAVAERIGVDVPRRAVLGLGVGVALWGAVVVWGHPEDAMALGFALYALLFGIDNRWNGAAWLFGVAMAMQPLVIVTLPLLLVMAGRSRTVAFLLRAALPSVAVLLGPAVTNFYVTARALLHQTSFPRLGHETPWTVLASRLKNTSGIWEVAAGPGHIAVVVLACGVAWWARRWRDRPEMLVWTFALVLVLRPLTESVMISYYLFPALAVGMLAASRSAPWRFGLAIAASVFVTASSSLWNMPWASWFGLNVAATVCCRSVRYSA